MTTLFISDLHLDDQRPDITALFVEFLQGEARQAESLYILGDLFEFWIGDDALSDTAKQVADALQELSETGVPIRFMVGNRDFLLGEGYASMAGFQILQEPEVIELYGTPTLLMHGDVLCTDDVEYQLFREQVRNPAWQEAFLDQTIEQRLQMAQQARGASKEHMQSAKPSIMDVNREAVLATFQEHQVPRLIHGHTHRPDIHDYEIDGRNVQRIVLGDWYTQGSVLRVDEEGFQLEKLPLT